MLKSFHSHITGLQDTLHLLNETALEQAVRALQEASRIEFYGNGGSGIIAMDAYHKFMRTGISCIAHTDSHFQIMGQVYSRKIQLLLVFLILVAIKDYLKR